MKKITTSILLWDVQQQLLARAAQRRGMNVSEYFRDIVVPFVAGDCGAQVPVVPRVSQRPTGESGSYPAVDLQSLAAAVVDELTRRTVKAG